MKHGIHAQSERRVINNKKGHIQATITRKEDAITFTLALRSDRGELKRHHEVIKHRNVHKRQKNII